MRSTRRWTAFRALPRSPASARSSRRCADRARHRARHRGDPSSLGLLGGGAHQYAAFEAGLKAPASEVYLHEMPGGQFTNLKAQARSMGLEERWHEVAHMYAEVNRMFGDIVKVTPSSKVVGDMALMMVAQGLTGRRSRIRRRGGLPRERRRHDEGQPRAAAGRLAEGAAGEDPEGGAGLDRAAGAVMPPADLGRCARRPRSSAARARRSTTRTSTAT